MKRDRKVYIVMAYDHTLQSTYISEVCSSKKKAREHEEFISGVMKKHEPGKLYTHWVCDMRVV